MSSQPVNLYVSTFVETVPPLAFTMPGNKDLTVLRKFQLHDLSPSSLSQIYCLKSHRATQNIAESRADEHSGMKQTNRQSLTRKRK